MELVAEIKATHAGWPVIFFTWVGNSDRYSALFSFTFWYSTSKTSRINLISQQSIQRLNYGHCTRCVALVLIG